MKQLWSTLLAFLFAHSQLARWMTHVFDCLCRLDQILADPDLSEDFRTPICRIRLESLIAQFEDWIAFLVAARAAELAGVNYTHVEQAGRFLWSPAIPRDWDSLMQRCARLRISFRNIERMARRRAARLKREIAGNPLTIIDPLAMLRVVATMLDVGPRLERGTWIVHPCAQDEGGRAFPRGPPPDSFPETFRPRLAGQPARSRAFVSASLFAYAATRSPQSRRSDMSAFVAARSGSARASAGR